MGQYAEAAQVYELVMQERPNYRSGFNLLLCYHTLGQHNKSRRAFTDLIRIPYPNLDDDYEVSVKHLLNCLVNSFIFYNFLD